MSPYEFSNVLVLIDDSPDAGRALDCALSICHALGARLTALAVEGRLPAYASTVGEVDEAQHQRDDVLHRVLSNAEEIARERAVELRTELIPGQVPEAVLYYAVAHAHDLIVVGYRGHFLGDVLMGTTADRVAHHAHCPVMVVR